MRLTAKKLENQKRTLTDERKNRVIGSLLELLIAAKKGQNKLNTMDGLRTCERSITIYVKISVVLTIQWNRLVETTCSCAL